MMIWGCPKPNSIAMAMGQPWMLSPDLILIYAGYYYMHTSVDYQQNVLI
jgi:hypothetical protein